MKVPARVFEPNVFSLHGLAQEHVEICQMYEEIERAIVLMREMPVILDASRRLVQLMLRHFAHEERFLERLSPVTFQRQRDANLGVSAQLLEISEGLGQGRSAAVFRLLLLGKAWIKEHMQQESGNFEEDPFPGNQLFDIPA
jgi:hemerythrin